MAAYDDDARIARNYPISRIPKGENDRQINYESQRNDNPDNQKKLAARNIDVLNDTSARVFGPMVRDIESYFPKYKRGGLVEEGTTIPSMIPMP